MAIYDECDNGIRFGTVDLFLLPAHAHGHNGRAVIKISSPELDDRGMVLDFSDIKTVVSNWIDENLDHRMILHHEDFGRMILHG